MTALAKWISPDVIRPLGWALLHFLWQGAALAAALSAMTTFCRRASLRYLLAVGTLILMVAAPVITFLRFLAPASANTEWAGTVSRAAAAVSLHGMASAAAVTLALQQRIFQTQLLLRLVEAWFAGVVFFSLRAAGGLFLVETLKRREARPLSRELLERCMALERRLGLDRAIRYCESRRVATPAVIGWFRPVVLLPLTALTGLSEHQIDAVIAHELAHIRRLDCFVNLFQVLAEALLFYHPAVWWVSRRIRVERENCCDDAALEVCPDPAEYARALTLMEEWRTAPILAMAANASPLAARVRRLLGVGRIAQGMRSAGLAASFVCLAGALVAGNALLSFANRSLGFSATLKHAPSTGRLWTVSALAMWSEKPTEPSGGPRVLLAQASPSTAAKAREAKKEGTGEEVNKEGQSSKEGFIEQLQAAGLKGLTVDQLVAMKTQGVTPEYVRQIRALGLTPEVDDLMAMRVQGVTPEYIRDMRASGINASVEQLTGMKVQGVTPEYVKAMHDFGLQPDADELMGMRVQGVTPEYIRDLRATGLKPAVEQLVGMKVQGVTPEYVRALHDLGLQPDADTLMGMRVQGVTPEYIRKMREAGLKPSAEELVAMRVQGVSPDYVKALQAAGLRNLNADEYVAAKVQDITPEFVEKARKHGFQDLTLDKLLQLRHAGVL